MRYYININKALAIGALVVTGVAAVVYLFKESKKSSELNEYKDRKLGGIDKEINAASIENEKLDTCEDRASAKEVLYHLKDRVRNASTKAEVDSKFADLITSIDSFKINDPVSVKASIIFHKERLETIRLEGERMRTERFEKEKIIEAGNVAARIIRAVGCYL